MGQGLECGRQPMRGLFLTDELQYPTPYMGYGVYYSLLISISFGEFCLPVSQ
jgi:hypothetical protein